MSILEKQQYSITIKLILFSIVLLSIAVFTSYIPKGTFTIDEGLYYWSTQSLREGSLIISNGSIVEEPSFEIRGNAPLLFWVDESLQVAYPPGFALLALPFYLLLGFPAFYFINTLSVLLLTCLVALHSSKLTRNTQSHVAWLASFILIPAMSIAAVSVWPHGLITLLIFASYLFLCRSNERGVHSIDTWTILAVIFLSIALTIRFDSILAVTAIFLSLFIGKKYLQALYFTLLFIPVLFLLSVVHYYKFNLFFPFVYGPTSLGSVMSHGTKTASLTLTLLLLICILQCIPKLKIYLLRHIRSAAILSLIIAIQFFPSYLTNLYRLLFHFSDSDSISRYEFLSGTLLLGQTTTQIFATHKLSLLQQAPILAIGLVSMLTFQSSHFSLQRSASLLIPTMYILFYGLTGWHGALSLEMRYFYPAVPFLALYTIGYLQHANIIKKLSIRHFCLTVFAFAAMLLPFVYNKFILLDLGTILAISLLLAYFMSSKLIYFLLYIVLPFQVSIALFQVSNLWEARSRSEKLASEITRLELQHPALIITDGSDMLFPVREYKHVDIASLSIFNNKQWQEKIAGHYQTVIACCIYSRSEDRCQERVAKFDNSKMATITTAPHCIKLFLREPSKSSHH